MIKVENEYYVRFILLLIKGGTHIMRKIAFRELQFLNTDIDTLLASSKGTIKTLVNDGTVTKAQGKFLNLQNSGVVSDISKWDISLISSVLLHIIRGNISALETLGIKKIRDMRNEFQAHHPDGSMDRHTYEIKWTELTLIINTLSFGFPDTERAEINDIILRLASEPLDISSAVEQLKQSDIKDDFYDNVQRNLQYIQELKHIIESGFKICHEGYMEVKEHLLDLKVRLDQQGKYVRGVQMHGLVYISADEQDAVVEAERVLIQASRDSINGVESDSYHKDVRDEFENLRQPLQERGLDIKSVGKGSIVYIITYTSFEGLLNLIDFFESQFMKQCLIGIAKALNQVVGRNIRLTASISQKSLDGILKLTESSNIFTATGNIKVLDFEIECTGTTGLLHAWGLFQEGQVTHKLDALSKSLSETIGKPIKLAASLDIRSIKDAVRQATTETDEQNIDRMEESKKAVHAKASKPETTSLTVTGLREMPSEIQTRIRDLREDLVRFLPAISLDDQNISCIDETKKDVHVTASKPETTILTGFDEIRSEIQTIIRTLRQNVVGFQSAVTSSGQIALHSQVLLLDLDAMSKLNYWMTPDDNVI